jgi:hypothetical protein
MTTPASPPPNGRSSASQPSALVRDRERAEALIIDLTDRGIARDQVTVRPPTGSAQAPISSRRTGEHDTVATERAGKRMGSRALLGGLIGAAVGFVASLLIFGPPWENGVAAGLTIAVTIGVGYVVGGIGLLQGGIAEVGESGDAPVKPRTTDDVVIEVEALDDEQVRAAHEVFNAHGADPVG